MRANRGVHLVVSRAFVKEDVDPPERSGRIRSASGLPPGAVNYITARGAQRLRDELTRLRGRPDSAGQVTELERLLASVSIVPPADATPEGVTFGSTVTVKAADGKLSTYTIVGVDELDLEPDAVSWISPLGKALLAADVGDRVVVGDQAVGKVVKVEYRAG